MSEPGRKGFDDSNIYAVSDLASLTEEIIRDVDDITLMRLVETVCSVVGRDPSFSLGSEDVPNIINNRKTLEESLIKITDAARKDRLDDGHDRGVVLAFDALGQEFIERDYASDVQPSEDLYSALIGQYISPLLVVGYSEEEFSVTDVMGQPVDDDITPFEGLDSRIDETSDETDAEPADEESNGLGFIDTDEHDHGETPPHEYIGRDFLDYDTDDNLTTDPDYYDPDSFDEEKFNHEHHIDSDADEDDAPRAFRSAQSHLLDVSDSQIADDDNLNLEVLLMRQVLKIGLKDLRSTIRSKIGVDAGHVLSHIDQMTAANDDEITRLRKEYNLEVKEAFLEKVDPIDVLKRATETTLDKVRYLAGDDHVRQLDEAIKVAQRDYELTGLPLYDSNFYKERFDKMEQAIAQRRAEDKRMAKAIAARELRKTATHKRIEVHQAIRDREYAEELRKEQAEKERLAAEERRQNSPFRHPINYLLRKIRDRKERRQIMTHEEDFDLRSPEELEEDDTSIVSLPGAVEDVLGVEPVSDAELAAEAAGADDIREDIARRIDPALARNSRVPNHIYVLGGVMALATAGALYGVHDANERAHALEAQVADVSSQLKSTTEASTALQARVNQYETPAQLANRFYGSKDIDTAAEVTSHLGTQLQFNDDFKAYINFQILRQGNGIVQTTFRNAFGLDDREAITLGNIIDNVVVHEDFRAAVETGPTVSYTDSDAQAALRTYLTSNAGKEWLRTRVLSARMTPADAASELGQLLRNYGTRLETLETRRTDDIPVAPSPTPSPSGPLPPGDPGTPYDRVWGRK